MAHPIKSKPSAILGMALMLLLMLAWPVTAAPLALPKLDNWVVDTTHTFSKAQHSALAQQLSAFEQNKGAQIFVLVVPTTGEEDIAQYSRRVYDQWQLGREKIDDGVLLLVAKQDRRLRIEVGYGLEGAITDLQAGRIINEFITPYFKKDDYVGGIQEGVKKIMALVAGEPLPPPASQSSSEQGSWSMLLPLAIFAVVLPPLASAVTIGLFTFFIFGSLILALFAAAVAFVLSLVGKVFGAGGRGNSARASRRGAFLGGLGSTRGRRGGGGGGFGGGGGGRSGGGGASGGW
ncbi:TPM domain-containing protein [Oceanisphaera avium]|uniref:Dehydrogenase n=1 Tax=Oceanisphaera avium TaxID=1903694 RepID=A0A1Y0D0I7_9GAMM|nr:YgcG family protein [Oceanisphaera avium]ART80647.1 dehydrogenase [Oceanisphaera avium]